MRAWTAAAEERSFLVTSGTGSGKTECFMVPMLNDLLRQSPAGRRRGVQAIVLYPLNALIDSQRERLGEWIAPLSDRIFMLDRPFHRAIHLMPLSQKPAPPLFVR